MISVIIPLYNKVAIVERSVQSVLSQSFTDFELIVVDDGSTDGSAEVLEDMQDNRITLIRQENGGPGMARNTGIERARGKWLLLLDADDELLPDALARLNEVAQSYPDADIIDGAYIVREGKQDKLYPHTDGPVGNNYKSFFFREVFPSTGHTLFRRELLIQNPYNVSIRRYEDVELTMHLLKKAKIVTVSFPVFRVNTAFSCASRARPTIKEDFMGHLDFQEKGFWERMCLYQLYLGERDYYPQEVRVLYPTLHLRYDLLILYKLLLFLKKKNVL